MEVLNSVIFALSVYNDIMEENFIKKVKVGDRRFGLSLIGTKLFVSFSGSKTLLDWVRNLNPFTLEIVKTLKSNASWVKEFNDLECVIKLNIHEAIGSHNVTEVIFTGHSYGGVLAHFSNLRINLNVPTSVITFGCPHFCSVKSLEGHDANNIINVDDAVNLVGKFFHRFYRLGKDIMIDDLPNDDLSYFDDHRIKTYYKILKDPKSQFK